MPTTQKMSAVFLPELCIFICGWPCMQKSMGTGERHIELLFLSSVQQNDGYVSLLHNNQSGTNTVQEWNAWLLIVAFHMIWCIWCYIVVVSLIACTNNVVCFDFALGCTIQKSAKQGATWHSAHPTISPSAATEGFKKCQHNIYSLISVYCKYKDNNPLLCDLKSVACER